MSDEQSLAMAALRSADREIVALKARVEELEAAHAEWPCPSCGAVTRARMADDPMVEGQRWLTDVTVRLPEYEQLHARVEVLTAALTDALEGLEEMRPYVSQHFAEKWGHDSYITRARAALAAGESEA